jgi:carbamate kinase
VLVVAALGGNALIHRGESPEPERQRRRIGHAVDALAALGRKQSLVITHGNGPQIGLLALQSEAGPSEARLPLDVLGAESEGMIGYWIEQELRNRLPDREVITLLTQVEVDGADSAFSKPTKPIGPVYEEAVGRRLAEERGWDVAADGDGVRRVVPSPEPLAILGVGAVRLLVDAGMVVVCAGGGGIPVVRDPAGVLHGVEGVIDKDLSAQLLASSLGAEVLLLLTDVPAVFADWPEAREPLQHATPEVLRATPTDPGTMGPKVEAACRFVEAGGRRAAIGALEDAGRLLGAEAGTQVTGA